MSTYGYIFRMYNGSILVDIDSNVHYSFGWKPNMERGVAVTLAGAPVDAFEN